MLHISTFGSRIFSVDLDRNSFVGLWRNAVRNGELLELESTDGPLMIPPSAVSSITVS